MYLLRRFQLAGCVLLALADAPTANAQAIAGALASSYPAPCLEAVVPMFGTEVVQIGTHSMLAGMGSGANLSEQWKRGNAYYDRAFSIARASIARDEEINGAWIKVTARDYLEMLFRRAPLEEQQYLQSFFATPEGEIFWHFMLDSAKCNGFFIGLTKRKVDLSLAEQKVAGTWKEALQPRKQEYEAAFASLSPTQRKAFNHAFAIVIRLSRSEADDEREFQLKMISEEALMAAIRRSLEQVKRELLAAVREFSESQ
ncbi:hypothetical protein [Piscinibacter gummiphilus]|uniref:DUF2059 domain-containing protein n=1 Tax=Piscinibacter gummiphilus TaxID=946333 RepID=A0ABZ0CVJ4_9BURK|nr:hypothetical protein [Piscinibacter gummiphilus]WOB06957.1 hypothetical protein RXV79_18765 [Piscinibacter gummiphilus]